jgi:TIGR03009 family protein
MLLNFQPQNGAFVSQQFVPQAVSTHRRPQDATLPVILTSFQDFICRTERILAQMPLINKWTWLQLTWPKLCVCCLAGAWCSTATAQTTTQAKRYPPAQPTVAQRQAPRDADDEEAIPSSAGRSKLGTRPGAGNQGAAGQNGAGGRAPNQAGRAVMQPAQPALPVGQAMRIPNVTPEVDAILKEWEQKSSKVTRLEGAFERTTYDQVFSVQKVSTGTYCFEYPDKGSFHQIGTDVAEGAVGKKNNPATGTPYALKRGPNERWICDGKGIIKFDDDKKDKVYSQIEIPEEDRGQNIRNAPLPFVFGMKAAAAKQRYEFELNAKQTNEKQIWIKVKPLLQQDSANYSEAEVILDRSNCLPLAVKLTGPTKKSQDVYFFPKDKLVVNSKGWVRWLTGDPLKPDLRGYKKLVSKEDGVQMAPLPTDRRSALGAPEIGPKPLGPKAKPRQTAEVVDDDADAVVPARKTSRTRQVD